MRVAESERPSGEMHQEFWDLTSAVGRFLDSRPGPERDRALTVLIESYDLAVERRSARSKRADARRERYERLERGMRVEARVESRAVVSRVHRTMRLRRTK